MKYNTILAAALLVAAPLTLPAARLGDPAAPLTIQEWVKGKPVDVKDGKNVYVVEFWATWCGPCLQSIPHLTEVQKKFKDKGVVMVGISDEKVETVKPFVDKMADKMDYVVACDQDRKSYAGYMKAYGQRGIPCAFIVGKQGTVLWVGHPMADLEKTLEDILAGKYDLEAAKKNDEGRVLMDDFQRLSDAGDAQAKEVGSKLLTWAGNDVQALCDLAFKIVVDTKNEHRNFAFADEVLDKAEKAAGGKNAQVMSVRAIGRFEAGKQTEGISLIKEALALSQNPQEKERYQRYLQVMESRQKEAAKP